MTWLRGLLLLGLLSACSAADESETSEVASTPGGGQAQGGAAGVSQTAAGGQAGGQSSGAAGQPTGAGVAGAAGQSAGAAGASTGGAAAQAGMAGAEQGGGAQAGAAQGGSAQGGAAQGGAAQGGAAQAGAAQAGAAQAGAAQGGSAQGGAGGEASLCGELVVVGPEIGVTLEAKLKGVERYDLARAGQSTVVVAAVSAPDFEGSIGFGWSTSFDGAAWPAADVGPMTQLTGWALSDLALARETVGPPVVMYAPISNSGVILMGKIDLSTGMTIDEVSAHGGGDPIGAAFAAELPTGMLGGVNLRMFNQPSIERRETRVMGSGDGGQGVLSSVSMACAQGASTGPQRPLVSAFHRPGDTVVATASSPDLCTGDTAALRVLSYADSDASMTPSLVREIAPGAGDLYEGVHVADAGGGDIWVVSRQLGLNAEVQPPLGVRRLGEGGGDALTFDVEMGFLDTRHLAVAPWQGGLLLAAPDTSLEGQGTVGVQLYTKSGALAGAVSVGQPLAAGGPHAFIDSVRAVSLGDGSFVVGYLARAEPKGAAVVRLVKIACAVPL